MAAGYVSHATATPGETGSATITCTNVNAGGGTLVVVIAQGRAAGGETWTGCTYNGSSTGVTSIITNSLDGGIVSSAWYVAGASGTADVVVTASGSDMFNRQAVAYVLGGTETVDPVRDSDLVLVTEFPLTISGTLTTVADDICVDHLLVRGVADCTEDAGQTNRAEVDGSNGTSATSTKAATTTSTTMGWTQTQYVNFRQVLIAIKAGSGAASLLPLLGGGLATLDDMRG